MPFRQAHQVVGKLVHYGIANNVPLQKMSLTQLKEFEPLIADDVYDVLDPENAVARRISLGSTGFDQVKYQIKQAKETLAKK